MKTIRFARGIALATGLAVGSALLVAGCGSGTDGGTPGGLNPEMEKKTQEMLKNKSQDYNKRFKANGGKPG